MTNNIYTIITCYERTECVFCPTESSSHTDCLVNRQVLCLRDLTEVSLCDLKLTLCPHALTQATVFNYALSL